MRAGDHDRNRNHGKLCSQDASTVIEKLRNFPTLPCQLLLVNRNQEEVLAQYFPWGCSTIRQTVSFGSRDMDFSARFHDYSNICLGVKYGICPFFGAESFKFINDKFNQSKKAGVDLYLKLIATDNRRDKILALGRVTEINPSKTFRFWHHQKGTIYPLGVAKMEVVAVGETEDRHKKLQQVYEELKSNMLQWKYFNAADDLERIEREKYVLSIKNNQCQKLEKELEEKNLSMLDIFRK